ncbi:kinase-like protein [Choiromyces venosus 120613-1]|uniref:Kinase-like protein n=1 Tax=Choiromyces venosus 120613-1 TaxID=1336337 RepID=A0A3N4JHN9_9PEZI|nr:kinase-like protein [Choiromyces venosus 120613-1]
MFTTPSRQVAQVTTRKVPPALHPLLRYPRATRIDWQNSNTRQIWDLGNGKLYKRRPHRAGGVYECDIRTLVQSVTSIPIPTIYHEWVTTEGCPDRRVSVHHMIMEKVEGESLDKEWPYLHSDTKERLAIQFAEYVDQLRRIIGSSICTFDGGPLPDDHEILFDRRYISRAPITDDESLWAAMTSHLQRSHSLTIQQALMELRPMMPQSFPAVLTHADLHAGNVMVRNEKIVAIIDWEDAAFYPCWMEYVKIYHCSSDPELEFEHLVVNSMEAYPAARKFIGILDALRISTPEMIRWAVRELRSST